MIKKLDESASKILNNLIGKSGLQVIQLQNDWQNIIPDAWKNTQPIEIKPVVKSNKKILVVKVSSSAEATLLHYNKPHLIQKLSLYFGKDIIQDIILKIR